VLTVLHLFLYTSKVVDPHPYYGDVVVRFLSVLVVLVSFLLSSNLEAKGLCATKAGVVTLRAVCKRSEVLVDLASLGPTGPQGIRGETGPKGDTGLQGQNGSNGANGINGNTILNGSVAPSIVAGALNDFYLDTTANKMYGPKSVGGWGSGVSLVGPQGEQGIQGPIGLTGITGPTGATGLTGPQGPVGSTGPAGATGTFQAGTNLGDMLYWDGNKWAEIKKPSVTVGATLKFCDEVPSWNSCFTPSGFVTFDSAKYLIGVDSNLPQGNAPRTIEAWIRSATEPTSYPINGKGSIVDWGGSKNCQRSSLLLEGAAPYFSGMGCDLTGYKAVLDGVWHKITITYDGAAVSIFVDGVLDEASIFPLYPVSTVFGLNTVGNDLHIANSPYNEKYVGDISAVSIYSRVLTLKEIHSMNIPLGTESGLVSFFDL
jgi:hypothetical protein